jgi:hypothetical protein
MCAALAWRSDDRQVEVPLYSFVDLKLRLLMEAWLQYRTPVVDGLVLIISPPLFAVKVVSHGLRPRDISSGKPLKRKHGSHSSVSESRISKVCRLTESPNGQPTTGTRISERTDASLPAQCVVLMQRHKTPLSDCQRMIMVNLLSRQGQSREAGCRQFVATAAIGLIPSSDICSLPSPGLRRRKLLGKRSACVLA